MKVLNFRIVIWTLFLDYTVRWINQHDSKPVGMKGLNVTFTWASASLMSRDYDKAVMFTFGTG